MSDIDARARSPRRPDQSNLRSILPLSWPTLRHAVLCPRREWSRRERRDIDEAPKGELSGESESIEPTLHTTLKLASLLALGAVSPAGIEPTFKV